MKFYCNLKGKTNAILIVDCFIMCSNFDHRRKKKCVRFMEEGGVYSDNDEEEDDDDDNNSQPPSVATDDGSDCAASPLPASSAAHTSRQDFPPVPSRPPVSMGPTRSSLGPAHGLGPTHGLRPAHGLGPAHTSLGPTPFSSIFDNGFSLSRPPNPPLLIPSNFTSKIGNG